MPHFLGTHLSPQTCPPEGLGGGGQTPRLTHVEILLYTMSQENFVSSESRS